ncbi:hypothetical protein B0T22DRAFT_387931 [Podospora appendiculata]|uniref:Uncharacterized protein n=1 Tax=Podospora appendiculata TaxID=314037 RepID=A0AAE0WZ54_9PEZI|nr:hypothetical protein B0T22DRAFT_387931 [Podospora appendiculata]
MFTTKSLALLLAAAASTAAAAVALPNNITTVIQADYWAQFCDDTDCSQGCGESVQVSNPGCLGETGRRSILFHGGAGGDYALVVSPSGNCPCQSTCASVPTGVQCWDISQYQSAQSFRFIGGSCGADNC